MVENHALISRCSFKTPDRDTAFAKTCFRNSTSPRNDTQEEAVFPVSPSLRPSNADPILYQFDKDVNPPLAGSED